MTDELLPYYNRELAFLRKMGAEFAEANPKIAARLRLGAEGSDDPHVARILEAFAYLNARTRHKIEDDFPEITEALLGVLYPHFLAPLPSTAIVQLELDPSQGELTEGYTVPRGAALESEAIGGQACRFQTCYPVTLWPIVLKEADLKGQPFQAPATSVTPAATAALRLQLECTSQQLTFAQLPIDRLRFFLCGQSQYMAELYELLLNNTLAVVVATGAEDRQATILRGAAIRPVGFERDEGLFDCPPRGFLGYRLWTEYFAFPEKFLFCDITGLTPAMLQRMDRRLELFVLFDRQRPDLERHISTESFRLGCTPVVNLFRQQAEPIRLTQTQTQYHVVPDARRPAAHEVYSIDRVVATSPGTEEYEYRPFYSVEHGMGAAQPRAFWHATRRLAHYAGGKIDHGTEVDLVLVDLDFQPAAPADWTLHVETTCLNRDLPQLLPFGGGKPRLQLLGGAALVSLRCLTPPTPTRRRPLRHGTLWQLISHLSLNHLSLVDTEEGAEALREILKLYDYVDSPDSRAVIEGILNVQSHRVVGRVPGAGGGFCRGLEVTVHFDEARFAGSGLFLLAAVLERFLGLYCSINSFTKMVATSNQRDQVVRRWPPRAGEKVLL